MMELLLALLRDLGRFKELRGVAGLAARKGADIVSEEAVECNVQARAHLVYNWGCRCGKGWWRGLLCTCQMRCLRPFVDQ